MLSWLHCDLGLHLNTLHLVGIHPEMYIGKPGQNKDIIDSKYQSIKPMTSAPVSQRSWVQIPYGPKFFQVLFSTTRSSSVLSCEDLINYEHFSWTKVCVPWMEVLQSRGYAIFLNKCIAMKFCGSTVHLWKLFFKMSYGRSLNSQFQIDISLRLPIFFDHPPPPPSPLIDIHLVSHHAVASY